MARDKPQADAIKSGLPHPIFTSIAWLLLLAAQA
ncbi:hypothetical protein BTW15_12865 [Pseudomonas syringae pv. tomato]|uniref:Uncharacterized protein n=5 Tax=Pseudomonas syringae group TaxID=136849 RepID=Q88AE8_PSESM|nr:hypothetical protein PSPTO_0442 [Pseudomonas syringae pv. tomato str. DC3000]AQX61751.1 hypothetical protein B1R35_29470 [Pseudomonas syringae pv. actinidiae]AVB18279.1 hypothetical protein BKM03_02525 [Pseudomonas avellanae]AVI82692.1 hypothetical protein XJ28_02470 [Pseudomonas syringae pv. tomato]AYL83787.1 hypothetical protein CN228_31315 [Pseudomonas syringae pv. actinidiae str. Shaanxi_M228]EGH65715.1 hypothetical protein PSYAC_12526 [Pseudomonas syringae pv. actinidiae str. M302091]